MEEIEEQRRSFELAIKNKIFQKVERGQSEESTLIRCFKHHDADNDDHVSQEEWIKAIEKIGIAVISHIHLQHLFQFYDLAQSGKINYRDFAVYLYHPIPIK